MRSAFFGFHVASSGLFTARANLNVTSHNIANAEIPGFSRQVAQARASRPLNLQDSRGMYGTGSQVTGIIQIRDRFLDKKFWGQRAIQGEFTAKNTHLNFIETVFNQLPNAGVLRAFNEFFSRLHDAADRAHDPTFRTNLITGSETLAEMIRHNAHALQRQQMDLNREVADVVTIINSLGSQIASLNEQIHIFERDGSNANDLRDQRALLIDELSMYVNVQVEERDFSRPGMPHDRRLSVMINGYDFVNHDLFNRLELAARTGAQRRNAMDIDGLYDIRFAGTGSAFNIYSPTLSGVLKGLIDVRDGNNAYITREVPVSGIHLIQAQLNRLEQASDAVSALNSRRLYIDDNIGAWVAARGGHIAALSGLRPALDFAGAIDALRLGIPALGLTDDTEITALIDSIEALLDDAYNGGLNSTEFAERISALRELADIDPEGNAALASFLGEIDGFLDNIEAVPDATIDGIASVVAAISGLEAQISELETIADDLLAQMNRSLAIAEEIRQTLEARIAAITSGAEEGDIEIYREFLNRIEEYINEITSDRNGAEAALGVVDFDNIDPDNPDAWVAALNTAFTAHILGAGNFLEHIAAIEAAADEVLEEVVLLNTGTTTRYKGIPFYMNQLNELVRTFARAINEGRNAVGDRIDGTLGHIFGYNNNGDNLGTMFFTFTDLNTRQPAEANDLRRWILADPNNPHEPRRDPLTNEIMTVPDAEFDPSEVLRDENGNPLFMLDLSQMNALNFMVNPALISDPGLFAASSNPDIGEANNDVILGFNLIGTDRSLFREGRLVDFIIAVSNHLGVDNQQALNFRRSYDEITMQTHNHRLSVSGVDTNEEMMNLVRFQTMFVAASRLVNVLDSVYDTLINRLGNI